MKEPPPTGRVTQLRAAMKDLIAAMDAAVRETAADPNAGASDQAREEAVGVHFAKVAALLPARATASADASDAANGAPDARRDASDPDDSGRVRDATESPAMKKAIATMADVLARLERTFRLYVRATASGKSLARKEMRRVLSELKSRASEWQ